MEQTLKDVEFIFVDDKSTDNSMNIVRRVAGEYNRSVLFISHESNKGLPAARNTGLQLAKGEYIFHCDSDDWLEPTLLEQMVNQAEKNNADFAYCDFFLEYPSTRKKLSGPSYNDPQELVKRGFLAGTLKYNVWNKLIKKTLYKDITFPEGHNMGEDMTIILLAMKAHKCVHVNSPLYHYRKDNPNAYSNTFSQKHLDDIRFNAARVISTAECWGVPDIERFIAFFKLNVKLPFLFSGNEKQMSLWKSWYPESELFIEKNKDQPFRTRMIQIMARNGCFGLVQLYVRMVNFLYYKQR